MSQLQWIGAIFVIGSFFVTCSGTVLDLDSSGDGSGDSDISYAYPYDPILNTPQEEDRPEMRILWRDSFGDLRKESENARIENLMNYINADGLPEQFRRLTSEYLSEMILLISRRLGVAPFNSKLDHCTYNIPDRFYAINFSAYDSIRQCSHCIREIGVKYVNAVHQLVVELFSCLDNHIRSSEEEEEQSDEGEDDQMIDNSNGADGGDNEPYWPIINHQELQSE